MSGKMAEIPLAEIISPGWARAKQICRLMERHKGPLARRLVTFKTRFDGGVWFVWVFTAECPFGVAHEEISHEMLMHTCPDTMARMLAQRLLCKLAYYDGT